MVIIKIMLEELEECDASWQEASRLIKSLTNSKLNA
jgi:hypothetical protein